MTTNTQKNCRWAQRTVAILFALSLSACQNEEKQSSGNQKSAPETLRVAIAQAPITFDPIKATDATSLRVLNLVSFGLVKWAGGVVPEPVAAESLSHEGYQTFHITLKELEFQNGTHLTASWVKQFYESIQNPETGSPLRGQVSQVEQILTPDDKTVIFKLKQPNPFFWSVLQIPFVEIDKKTAEVFGLGNYQLAEIWENGNFLVKPAKIRNYSENARKNTQNTLKNPQKFETLAQTNEESPQTGANIYFQVVKEPMVRLLKLIKGSVDVVHNDIPPELFHHAETVGLQSVVHPSSSYTYLGFNFRDENVTSNLLLRQAIGYAINIEELQNSIIKNQSEPAESLLQKNNIYQYKALPLEFSPEKACAGLRKYWKEKRSEGGQVGGMGKFHKNQYDECNLVEPIELTLSITTNPFIHRIAQVFQQQLQRVNINLKIESAEWGAFYKNIKQGNFQIYLLTWVGNFQPDVFYSFFHSSQVPPMGANRNAYQNKQMDLLLERLMIEQDDQERIRLAQAVQKLQSDDVIYIPLWKRSHTLLMGAGVANCQLDLDGEYSGLRSCEKKSKLGQ